MKIIAVIVLLAVGPVVAVSSRAQDLPIIDMHLHA
jgi:hypothetical protein